MHGTTVKITDGYFTFSVGIVARPLTVLSLIWMIVYRFLGRKSLSLVWQNTNRCKGVSTDCVWVKYLLP